MKTIVIHRDLHEREQTLGVCYVKDECDEVIFKSECIERGWKDNQKRISCIPPGRYPVRLEYSSRFKKALYEIYNVPNRSECKFHSANYARQLNGCIALGQKRIDIDGDGFRDVTNSRKTMGMFHNALGGDEIVELHIKNV